MGQPSFVEQTAELLGMSAEEAFSVEEQEELYVHAYRSYESGDYAQSAGLFTKLVLCNPFSQKFWKGLASAEQMQSQYRAALHAWSIYTLLEDKDPYAHFHAAECLLSLEEKQDALKALSAAESHLLDRDTALRSKIEILKQVHVHG